MSLQDRIFDVEHALEGKPELDSFIDLMKYFNELETLQEYIEKENAILKKAIMIMDNDKVKQDVIDLYVLRNELFED